MGGNVTNNQGLPPPPDNLIHDEAMALEHGHFS